MRFEELDDLGKNGSEFFGRLWERLAGAEESDDRGEPCLDGFHAGAAEVACPRCSYIWLVGVDPRGRGRAARHNRLPGGPDGPEGRMAASPLPMERRAGGLPCSACDNEADLWRAPMVVHMPARAPGRRTVTPNSEALPPARQPVFRQP